jgi:predicted 3-demethylubiquinone-9 3-methyltransferase (glyoxalase superfamily)
MRVSNLLMFTGQAEEAMGFYVALFSWQLILQ